MSSCSTCGSELKNGAKYCKACGDGREGRPDSRDKRERVLAAEKKNGRHALVIGIVAIAVLAGVLFAVKGRGGMMRSGALAPQPDKVYARVAAEGGLVKIQLREISGTTASYFAYSVGGKEVRFFALRAADGSLRVALDACNACYRAKLGYHQQGDSMICNNCGMAFRSQDVGVVRGGCNPIPLERTVEGEVLVLRAGDLESGVKYF